MSERMSYVTIKTVKGCDAIARLIENKLKGFEIDDGAYVSLATDEFDEHAEAFVVYSRCVDKAILKARKEKENVQALARALANKLKA